MYDLDLSKDPDVVDKLDRHVKQLLRLSWGYLHRATSNHEDIASLQLLLDSVGCEQL